MVTHFGFAGGDQIASSVTQIWYSLRLSEKDHQFATSALQELIHASSLEELTSGIMKIDQDQLNKLVQVWRTWLNLSSRTEDWITKARERRFANDPGSRSGIDMYLEEIPEEHKQSVSDWFANGILQAPGSCYPRNHQKIFLVRILLSPVLLTILIAMTVLLLTSWRHL